MRKVGCTFLNVCLLLFVSVLCSCVLTLPVTSCQGQGEWVGGRETRVMVVGGWGGGKETVVSHVTIFVVSPL